MSALPPVAFEVCFVVPAELRWAMRAKGVIEDWLLSDECPAPLWNELLKARNSAGAPYCAGPERVTLRRAPRGRFRLDGEVYEAAFERGHVVAVATIHQIIPPAELPPAVYEHEAPLCDFEYMTHAWVLDDLTRVPHPVQVPTKDHDGKARNFQGLWEVPPDIAVELTSELEAAHGS